MERLLTPSNPCCSPRAQCWCSVLQIRHICNTYYRASAGTGSAWVCAESGPGGGQSNTTWSSRWTWVCRMVSRGEGKHSEWGYDKTKVGWSGRGGRDNGRLCCYILNTLLAQDRVFLIGVSSILWLLHSLNINSLIPRRAGTDSQLTKCKSCYFGATAVLGNGKY